MNASSRTIRWALVAAALAARPCWAAPVESRPIATETPARGAPSMSGVPALLPSSLPQSSQLLSAPLTIAQPGALQTHPAQPTTAAGANVAPDVTPVRSAEARAVSAATVPQADNAALTQAGRIAAVTAPGARRASAALREIQTTLSSVEKSGDNAGPSADFQNGTRLEEALTGQRFIAGSDSLGVSAIASDSRTGPAMRLSKHGLTAVEHEHVVNPIIASAFASSKTRLIAPGAPDYAFYDRDGVYAAKGIKVFVVELTGREYADLAAALAGLHGIKPPLDVIVHPGRARRQVYYFGFHGRTLQALTADERAQVAAHEALHIEAPEATEQEVQAKAPLPTVALPLLTRVLGTVAAKARSSRIYRIVALAPLALVRLDQWAYLTLGSMGGAYSRFLIGNASAGTTFPAGTLVINLAGCLLMGVFNGLAASRLPLSPNARVLLMTGFCGAFTTFSTFIFDTSNLIKGGHWALAALNLTLSIALGLLLFRLGTWLGKSF